MMTKDSIVLKLNKYVMENFGEDEFKLMKSFEPILLRNYRTACKNRYGRNKEIIKPSEYSKLKKESMQRGEKKIPRVLFAREFSDKELKIYADFSEKEKNRYRVLKSTCKANVVRCPLPSEYLKMVTDGISIRGSLGINKRLKVKDVEIRSTYKEICKAFGIKMGEVMRIEKKFVHLMREAFSDDEVREYLNAFDRLSLLRSNIIGA